MKKYIIVEYTIGLPCEWRFKVFASKEEVEYYIRDMYGIGYKYEDCNGRCFKVHINGQYKFVSIREETI